MSVTTADGPSVRSGHEPALPAPRGPWSARLIALLRGERNGTPPGSIGDPLADDVQLALYVAYELHYRGFAGVDPDLEWDPAVLAVRRVLEPDFEQAVRGLVDPWADAEALAAELHALAGPLGDAGPAAYLLRQPDRDRLREVMVHRSLYHLKEADPQAFALPRLTGAAKTLVAAVEFDEYGGGDPTRRHSALFADLMVELDLEPAYGAYLDVVPGPMLAVVNFMSYCGLHRRLRGALVGQLATVEIGSPLSSQRMVRVLDAHGAGPRAVRFYAEHVVADAVHERVLREAITDLVSAEPALLADVVFGIRAAVALDQRLDEHLLRCWRAAQTSLLGAI